MNNTVYAVFIFSFFLVVLSLNSAYSDPLKDIGSNHQSEKVRKAVQKTIQKKTFALDFGPKKIQGNQEIFEYLLDHLEICAVMGRMLEISNYQSRREPDGRIFGDNGKGATGYLTLLHAEKGERIWFLEGKKEGLFTVRGSSVLVLKYKALPTEKDHFEYRGEARNRVQNPFFAFFSRLFVARSRLVANKQFENMLNVPVSVTEKIYENPDAVLSRISSLSKDYPGQFQTLKSLIQSKKFF